MLKEKNWRQRIYFASLAALSVILSRGVITEAIRFLYPKLRPFAVLSIEPLINHSSSGSFPSGHSAAFFALAFVLLFFNKKWGWRFLGMALIMGLARIFVGVHWPSDILGGAVIGLISVIIIRKLLPSPEAKIKEAPALDN
ncbi:MAG: phosphatase PAP2 family protein [Patescibacteria group bacterium]